MAPWLPKGLANCKGFYQNKTSNVGIIPNPSTTFKPDPINKPKSTQKQPTKKNIYQSNPTRSRLITYQILTQIHQDTSDSVKLEVLRCVTLQTNLEVGVNYLFRESPVVEPSGLSGK